MVAPVLRRSCGVHSPFLPSLNTSELSCLRFFIGGRGEPSLAFLNIAWRSPICLLIDLMQTWPAICEAGKHHSDFPVTSFNWRNWLSAKLERYIRESDAVEVIDQISTVAGTLAVELKEFKISAKTRQEIVRIVEANRSRLVRGVSNATSHKAVMAGGT